MGVENINNEVIKFKGIDLIKYTIPHRILQACACCACALF